MIPRVAAAATVGWRLLPLRGTCSGLPGKFVGHDVVKEAELAQFGQIVLQQMMVMLTDLLNTQSHDRALVRISFNAGPGVSGCVSAFLEAATSCRLTEFKELCYAANLRCFSY